MGKLMVDGIDFSGAYIGSYPESKDQIYDPTSAVNITSNNVQDAINELDKAIETTQTNITNLENAVKSVTGSKVFDTFADMETWLKDSANANTVPVGTHLYIRATEVPDYWISGVLDTADAATGYYYEISELETAKVDLSGYYPTTNAWRTDAETARVSAFNLAGMVGIQVDSSGNKGLYGFNGEGWIVKSDTEGVVTVDDVGIQDLKTDVDTLKTNVNIKIDSYDASTGILYLVSV